MTKRPTTSRPASGTIPSTIWATGTEPVDLTDPWPAQIVSRAVREFSRPGDPVLLTDPTTPTRLPADIALIIVSLLPHQPGTDFDDQLAELAALGLRPGGLLVTLSRCAHCGDALCDPTGDIVAAAQTADLLYLQHIVAVPVRGDAVVTDDTEGRAVDHTDVLVFLQPRNQHDTNTEQTW